MVARTPAKRKKKAIQKRNTGRRTAAEVELLKSQVRTAILRGATAGEVRRKLGIDKATINRWLQEINEEWRNSVEPDRLEAERARLLAEAREVQRDAWDFASVLTDETQARERRGWMALVLASIKQQSELLGLNKINIQAISTEINVQQNNVNATDLSVLERIPDNVLDTLGTAVARAMSDSLVVLDSD